MTFLSWLSNIFILFQIIPLILLFFRYSWTFEMQQPVSKTKPSELQIMQVKWKMNILFA